MPRLTNNPNATASPPSSYQNHRRGRGSDGGEDVGDLGISKVCFLVLVLIAAMLPARVAGQSMTCSSAHGQYVQYSAFAVSYLKSIGPVNVTYTLSKDNLKLVGVSLHK